ncbi:MAG: CBS domain-containing protein [Chloroflexi bacterium]|nr:CBS domain-containing protein [Chloroflexota bacterium]MBM3182560.1 CBS domain-containing protein [Chloroflexota bacterium]MBM4451896.1 CBS domain-containing protein [Chloroflexota bacterium]MBM4453347.1 CBS domain-containing protein [Chloroflexota bacterium]
MKVKDVMTWNVVTIPSDTPIMEAKKIMQTHKVLRIPVVDKGKLVGIVTKERIDRQGPSPATSLSVWEINYLLAKMTVREVMQKDLVTVTPDTSVEYAVALAQSKGVGALPVVDSGKLVGIVTTNDFFYKVLNPMLGIGKPGVVRLHVTKGADPKNLTSVLDCIMKSGAKIDGVHTMPPFEGREKDLRVQVETKDVKKLISDLKAKGCAAEIVER